MANQIKTIAQLCEPRNDVAFNLSDLLTGEFGEKEARTFFEENYVTDGNPPRRTGSFTLE